MIKELDIQASKPSSSICWHWFYFLHLREISREEQTYNEVDWTEAFEHVVIGQQRRHQRIMSQVTRQAFQRIHRTLCEMSHLGIRRRTEQFFRSRTPGRRVVKNTEQLRRRLDRGHEHRSGTTAADSCRRYRHRPSMCRSGV